MGWIVRNEDFQEKDSLVDHLNILYQEKNVFVMDNHLAAGWCWYKMLDKNGTYSFCHIDQHDDLAPGNFRLASQLFHREEEITIDDYVECSAPKRPESVMPPQKVFRWDNYILLMKNIYPQWFSHELYACPESISKENFNLREFYPFMKKIIDIKVEENLNPQSLVNRTSGALRSSLKEDIERSPNLWIVNLDIDYFFRNHVQIFTDEYIRIICNQISEKMVKIAVLTIALSPECCGGWENAIRVYNIIAEQLKLQMIL